MVRKNAPRILVFYDTLKGGLFMYYLCGITEKGIKPRNEDCMLLDKTVRHEGALHMAVNQPFLAAVCDGVSGENAGELASQTCLKLLSAVKYTGKTDLCEAVLSIHEGIAQLGERHRSTENMQTTLCGIAVDEFGRLSSFNVGDSRLYRFRAGTLEQVSRDQTLVQLLYDEGTITSEEKRVHAERNVVLPVMGNLRSEPKSAVITFPEGLCCGDLLLLCTDGLTDYATEHEIAEILSAPRPLPERLNELVDRALQKGSRDNITVLGVVRYPEGVAVPI